MRRLEGISSSKERLRVLEHKIKSLKKTIENYRDLLQYAPTVIYEIDYKVPRLKSVNEEAIRATGYTKEELLSLSPFKLLDPESSERFKERLNRGAAGERIDENVEYKVMTKDGHDLWAVLYVKPTYKDGKLDSAVAFAYDVTERKKAEQELRDSEERFRLVAEAAKVMVYEMELGKDIVKIFSGEAVLGYGKEEICNSNYWWFSLIHPDDRAKVERESKKAIEAGIDALLEYRIKRKQGDYIIVHDTIHVVLNNERKATRVIGGVRDVTERNKAQEAIRENEERLELAQRVARLGSWEFYVKEDRAIWSRELFNIFDLKPQKEAPNIAEYSKLIHPDDLKRVAAMMDRLLTVGKLGDTLSFDYRIIHPDGSTCDLHSGRMIREVDEKGKAQRIVGIEQDITERKQLEHKLEEYTKNLEKIVEERTKQLQEKERLATIGETAGMVGHDIRNPLQAIVSELFLARQAMAEAIGLDSKDALESIDLIQEQVDYISKIVSDLQDYARPLKPEFVDVDVGELLVKVFETIDIPDKVKLKVDVKGTLRLKTDPTFVQRSLTNLVNNALQAMPDGGDLGLTAYKKENSMVIVVSDTGKGIPEDIKPNVFKPLMTTKAKGQGLGLAVVKRLIEGLNGKVSFSSEEDKGTKFTIELPVND